MKITVEFLSLPNLVKMVGSKTLTVEFAGQTIRELIFELSTRYGKAIREFLLDEAGQLDMHLTIAVKKKDWIRGDQLDRVLQDGDRVTFMMLAAGG